MRIADDSWDIRCPKKFEELFPVRRGYYFKVGNEKAKEVLKHLSDEYGVKEPGLELIRKRIEQNALYDFETKTVHLYSRNHLKSVFHEFYHHLDNMTNGEYNSDDRDGNESSLSWMFAEKMWEAFREQKKNLSNPTY